MNKRMVAPLILLILLSGCKGGRPAGVDLGGTGFVSYEVTNADVGDKMKVAGKIEKVDSIEFYDNYIVVRAGGNEGHVLKVADLLRLDWKR